MPDCLLAAALVALTAALPGHPAPGGGARPPAHPDVTAQRAVQDCADCHRRATPAAVAAWEGGPHGLALVKCLVCHGSTGRDFTRAAGPDRCGGCHAAEVASVTPARGKPASCFACHAPHALSAQGRKSPHAR